MTSTPEFGAPIETRHHILGAILQAFHERPLISGIVLAGDFAGTYSFMAVLAFFCRLMSRVV